jgi:hypothetical protein
VVCDERRRDNLRQMEVRNRWLTMCHICAARTLKLAKIPSSIDALRRQLERDRRQNDRRGDGLERRVFPRERRVGDRRGPVRANDATDPGFVMPDFEDIVIEIQEADIEVVEQTLVRESNRVKPVAR